MKTSNPVAGLVAVVAIAAAAGGGWLWWKGRPVEHAHAAPAAGASAAAFATPPVDPSGWSVAQGDAATRRHLAQGLKAGDVDPVTGRRILHYQDPMVPGRKFEAPGKSPYMDMMLVPLYAGAEAGDPGTVTVSPRIRQNLGLRTAPVERAALAPQIEAVGAIAWNERDQVLLQARAAGFVEKVHVRATLDRVAAGAPLAEIHVPAWVAAQEEYLALRRMSGEGLAALVDAARQRMRLAGMDEAQIAEIEAGGRVQPHYRLVAPIGGVVTELQLREGMAVMAGATLARIQGTSRVWAEAEVPESQAALLHPGMTASGISPSLPGRTIDGRVQLLLPDVNAATRTRKARLELANPGAALVPGQFVRMRFDTGTVRRSLVVPSDAVIHTGRRTVVMLAEEDGRFRPVAVRTGVEAGDRTEIVEGLAEGQRVVLSGQFLIDSEASLKGLEVRLNQEGAAAAAPPPGATTLAAPAGAAKGVAAAGAKGAPPAGAAAAGNASPPAHRHDTAAVPDPAPARDASPATAPTPVAAQPPAGHAIEAVIDALDGDTASLAHPAIPALKWPAMTMDFRLPPAAGRPAGLAVGDRVHVEFREQPNDVPQITMIHRLAPAAAGASR